MKVLFVCTGNVFRSMTAKYCLKDYLKKNNIKGIVVDSAGTSAAPEPLDPFIVSELLHLGIDPRGHKQKKLNKRLVMSSDLIIAMAGYHQKFIREKFGVEAPLFNEVCHGKSESIWDVNDVYPDYLKHRKMEEEYLRNVIRHIHYSTPFLAKEIMLHNKR